MGAERRVREGTMAMNQWEAERTYRFPLNQEQPRSFYGGGSPGLGEGIGDWLAGPWGLGPGWIGPAVLSIGLLFQISFVIWFASATNVQELDYIPPAYIFWCWLIMAALLAALAVPWFVFVEPIIGRLLGGANLAPLAGRKPLLVVMGAVVVTVITFVAVIPAIDGNATGDYLYVAAESAFMIGIVLGLVYTILMAVTSTSYPLAHIGLVPAAVGLMLLLTALAGAGAGKGMMSGAGTAVAGTGPAGTGTGGTSDAPGSQSYSYEPGGSAPSGPSPTSSCPCPNGAGTRCNCPYSDNCDRTSCWNPGGGSIPGQCKHGCPY